MLPRVATSPLAPGAHAAHAAVRRLALARLEQTLSDEVATWQVAMGAARELAGGRSRKPTRRARR